MPNWVRNKMLINGNAKNIDDLLTKCNTDNNKFDFNGIIPMPPEVYRGNLGSKERELYPEELNWYGWSVKYWGTKWNSNDADIYRISDTEVSIVFDTAWSAPFPVFDAIKDQYPELNIEVDYADEDLGNNCGSWFNGYIIPIPINYQNTFQFACDIWGYNERDLGDIWGFNAPDNTEELN